MKTVLISLLLGAVVLTLSSCKKSNPVNSSSEQQIIPMKMGDSWVMQYAVYDTTGTTLETLADTSRVVSDTVIAGVTWYYVSSKISHGVYYTNKSDGLWLMTLGGSAGSTLLYKYPASVGDNWSVEAAAAPIITEGRLQADTSVTVPKGTYSCYEYDMLDNSQLVEQVDLCPGLGDVQVDLYSSTKSGRSYHELRGELVSASIN